MAGTPDVASVEVSRVEGAHEDLATTSVGPRAPWDREDAWVFLAATMRGRVEIRTLDRAADHMMHSRPNPGQVSASMSKLIGAGLFRFDGLSLRASRDACAMAGRAQGSTAVSPWQPGGWIDRALAELERHDVPAPAEPPAGFASWYDVLARRGSRTGRIRGRAATVTTRRRPLRGRRGGTQSPGRTVPRLTKTLLGRVRSDEGWSVVIEGPLAIVYSDGLGDIRVSAEARGGRRTGFELDADSLALLPRDRAALVVQRISDAFAYAGWHLRVNGGDAGRQ